METVTIKQVYDELKALEQKIVTKHDLNQIVETIGIMSNPETMKQIKRSEEDIRHGRVKKINSAKELMDEM